MTPSAGLQLSQQERRLIRESFQSVQEYADSVLLLFYGRLFELAPETRALFSISIREQAGKLMKTLRMVIDAMDDFEALRPQLAELGRRHVGYGVKPEYYQVLRSALLWAMGRALDTEFDHQTRAAWTSLLTAVSNAMLE